MKKMLFFLLVAILGGCKCMMAQIPPQIIYVDQNCQGLIPDYRSIVRVRDNCPGSITVSQVPAPGTLLTVSNPSAQVRMTATDQFGNTSLPMFITVTLSDTIPPVLEWPEDLSQMDEQGVIDLYKTWESAVKIHGIAKWMYDMSWTQGLTFADSSVIDRLKYFTNVIKLSDQEYEEYLTYKQSN